MTDVVVDLLSSDDENDKEEEEEPPLVSKPPPPITAPMNSCMAMIDLCDDNDSDKDDDNHFTALTPTTTVHDSTTITATAVTVSASRRRQGRGDDVSNYSGDRGKKNLIITSPVRYNNNNSKGYYCQSDGSDFDETAVPLGLTKQNNNNNPPPSVDSTSTATTTTSHVEQNNTIVRDKLFPPAVEKKKKNISIGVERHILEVDLLSSSSDEEDDDDEAPLSQSMEILEPIIMSFANKSAPHCNNNNHSKENVGEDDNKCGDKQPQAALLQPSTTLQPVKKRIEVDLLFSSDDDSGNDDDDDDNEYKEQQQPLGNGGGRRRVMVENPCTKKTSIPPTSLLQASQGDDDSIIIHRRRRPTTPLQKRSDVAAAAAEAIIVPLATTTKHQLAHDYRSDRKRLVVGGITTQVPHASQSQPNKRAAPIDLLSSDDDDDSEKDDDDDDCKQQQARGNVKQRVDNHPYNKSSPISYSQSSSSASASSQGGGDDDEESRMNRTRNITNRRQATPQASCWMTNNDGARLVERNNKRVVENPYKKKKSMSSPPSSQQSSSQVGGSDSVNSTINNARPRTISNQQLTPRQSHHQAPTQLVSTTINPCKRLKTSNNNVPPAPPRQQQQQYNGDSDDDSDADLFTNNGPTFSTARKRRSSNSSSGSSPRDSINARAPGGSTCSEMSNRSRNNRSEKRKSEDRATSVAAAAPRRSKQDDHGHTRPRRVTEKQQPTLSTTTSNNRPTARRGSSHDDDSDSDLELVPSTATTFAKNKSRRDASNSARNNSALQSNASSSSASPPLSSSTSNRRRPPLILQYPTLLSTSKQYPDVRAKYALAFWKFGRTLTPHAYERSRLDQVMKKVARLVLSEYPIRSLEEFMMMQSSSATISDQQKKQVARHLEAGGVDHAAFQTTPASRYGQGFYTIVEASLVAMYDHVQGKLMAGSGGDGKSLTDVLKDKDSWLSTKDLIGAVDQRLRPECPSKLTRRLEPDGGALYYLEPSTRSAEFLQISKLECELGDEIGPRIKRRRKQGQVYFELLESGYTDAKRIRGRSFPSPPGHYRCSKISTPENHYKDICLGVDRQEGGAGNNMVLHGMCGKLDMQRVPYFVGSLAIGDYVFFTSKGGGRRLDYYLCPIIIERKSIQDVAMSIHDGRWKSQKARMYKGQYIFGYNKCRMVYIIEGNEKKQLVSGNYIGTRFHNVDIDKLNEELDNLKSEGFDIVRTPSRENTMFELARWARRVAKEIKDGTLQASFTYQQFKDELKKIPKETDFSRLAKYHAAQQQVDQNAEVETRRGEKGSRVQATVLRGNERGSLAEASASRGSRAETPARRAQTSGDHSVPFKHVAKRQKIEEDDDDKLGDLTTSRLKELCKNAGLAASGKRSDLMDRYRGPHPPKLWLTRKKRGQHVPASYNTGGTAILVALYLHEKKTGGLDKGLSKDELYVKAEGLNISKNPFSGGTTQTGPYHYDGWSSMKNLLHGDPALVKLSKKRYKLTRSCDLAGYKVAEAMHKWCHEHEHCPCGG